MRKLRLAPIQLGLLFCSFFWLTCGWAPDDTVGALAAENGAPKLVSLAPSNTELIYSLGADKYLVAVSDVCDYPPEARLKPKAGSFVNAKIEMMVMLRPDWILLVNGQDAIAATLKARNLHPVILKNEKLSDISNNLKEIGKITGKQALGDKLADAFQQAVVNLKSINSLSGKKPRVFFCVWPEPLITAGAGSFIDDVITKCGGTNIASDIAAAYPRLNVEKIVTAKPDIIIMPHQAQAQDFWKKPPWVSTPAYVNKRIYFLPAGDKDPLERPTLRIVDGLCWLSKLLHPESTRQIEAWKTQTSTQLQLGK